MNAIRSALNGEYVLFLRTQDTKEVVAAFDGRGIHISLVPDVKTRSITVFRPNLLTLGTTQLLGEPTVSIARQLAEAGYRFESVDVGLWNAEVGVLLIDVDDHIDGVEICARDGS